MSTTGVIARRYFVEGYLCCLGSLLLLFLVQSSFCKIYQIIRIKLDILYCSFQDHLPLI